VGREDQVVEETSNRNGWQARVNRSVEGDDGLASPGEKGRNRHAKKDWGKKVGAQVNKRGENIKRKTRAGRERGGGVGKFIQGPRSRVVVGGGESQRRGRPYGEKKEREEQYRLRGERKKL